MFSWVCHWKRSNQGSWENPGGFATGIEHCHRYWNPVIDIETFQDRQSSFCPFLWLTVVGTVILIALGGPSVRFLPVFVTDGPTYGLRIAFSAGVHQTGLLIRGTVVGIYDLRRLQIKRCGRLGQRAVLALDCCLSITTRNVHPQVWALNLSPQMSWWPVFLVYPIDDDHAASIVFWQRFSVGHFVKRFWHHRYIKSLFIVAMAWKTG